ncbi:Uncharacterised protein [Mycobacteroides abscessus subsp. abscessus]|nr:Uncharacterised protein [Mycobacteroides abscessus subsp. abscessus]
MLCFLSEPPATQPAPTRSPSIVTARSSGLASTTSIAAPSSSTTTTEASIADTAAASRWGASTRSLAQCVPGGSVTAGRAPVCAGQSPNTIAARPPSEDLRAFTASCAAAGFSAATASAAGPIAVAMAP